MNYLYAGHDFGIINRRSQAYITEACQPWGLSYSEYVPLMELYDYDGCRQNELCKALKADKALIARSLKTLEAKGYVCRRQKDGDRRFKFIYVTPKGWDLQPKLEAILQAWIEHLVAGFEEEKLDELFLMMHTIAERAAEADVTDLQKEGDIP
ncbi:MarR family winged helix-turn-helix transcriptional regulator [uncultured Megasphaera sp.]|uniref:MarR family winged helix-turn-helix transcriptional regulator n=1 Tax=uncultured Megasphaera sp. TaxID=165188 RepID=UPI0025FDE6E9|nr:MarR family winged helix-turn-helix transcriptional regulator [uncultured Megasphaera sp.]